MSLNDKNTLHKFFLKKIYRKTKGVILNYYYYFFFGKSPSTPLKQPLNLQYPLNYQKVVNVPFKANKKWQIFFKLGCMNYYK
jgi:hypothetical protein